MRANARNHVFGGSRGPAADRAFRRGRAFGIPLGVAGLIAMLFWLFPVAAAFVAMGLALLVTRQTRPAGLGFLTGQATGFALALGVVLVLAAAT